MKQKTRLLIVISGLFCLFMLLVVQFYRLQILEHKKWAKRADQQHYFVISEPAVRGTFWANTGLKKGHPDIPQRLAVDIRKYHLHVDPNSCVKLVKTAMSNSMPCTLF